MSEDPRLTAYALNQLPPEERARFEAELDADRDGQPASEELSRLGEALRLSLAQSPLPEASSSLRSLVEGRLAVAEVQASSLTAGDAHGATVTLPARVHAEARHLPPRRLWVPLSLATALAITGTVIFLSKNLTHELASVGEDNTSILARMPGEPLPKEEMLNQVLEQDITPSKDLSLVTSSPSTVMGAMGSVSALSAPQTAREVADEVRVDVGETNIFSSTGTKLSQELPNGSVGGPQVILSPMSARGVALEGRRTDAERSKRDFSNPQPPPVPGRYGEASLAPTPLGAGGRTGTNPNSAVSPAMPSLVARGFVDTGDGYEHSEIGEVRQLLVEEEKLIRQLGADHPRVKAVRSRIELIPDRLGRGGPDGLHNTEAYDAIVENAFLKVADNPLSTFSIDVDTASYTNVRRFLTQENRLPPAGAVRIEEFVNYFTYDYPQPKDDVPFSVTTEVADCPWNAEHRLIRIGLKGREIALDKRPVSNLVFLVDVSGSMSDENKLPLVKHALKLLAGQLGENDRVAIVVYAGASGLVLPSTRGDQKDVILAALDKLQAGGSTNGAQGLELAYETASQNFIKGGTNRVILATDGDFNVGVTSQDELVRLIEEKAKTDVFFTALGFGMGNLKDSTLEKLADKGNGNYAYIDTPREAAKVFVEQMCGTLITIAKDVKLQLEFNPARVGEFRLLGYENRVLAHEDFNNDKKDAGDIGAGHTVTALYELIPPGKDAPLPAVDPLKYQQQTSRTPAADAAELLTVKLRYKQPDGETSKLIEHPVADAVRRWAQASPDFKFAASVASFGMLLRNSAHKGNATLAAVLELAGEGLGPDKQGHRAEFVELVKKAKALGK